MARLTGKAGAASVGSLTSIILDGWEYEETSTLVEITAAGDSWTEREHLRLDWRATVRGFLSATPPYAMIAIPTGFAITLVLKTLAADVNGLLSGTGIVSRGSISHPHDGPTRIEMEIVNGNGAAGLTADTSPAS